jgi:hypothetical protein
MVILGHPTAIREYKTLAAEDLCQRADMLITMEPESGYIEHLDAQWRGHDIHPCDWLRPFTLCVLEVLDTWGTAKAHWLELEDPLD